VGIGFGIHPGGHAAQGAHGALLAHGFGDFLQQHPDIGALGALYGQGILIFRRAALVPDVQNLDRPGLALHSLALTGQLIERLAVDLDRRVHGRGLHPGAEELRQNGQQLLLPCRYRGGLQHSAGHIPGIGALAQPEDSAVGLGVVELQINCLAGPAAEHRQNTGRHGVQRTAVAQFPGAQNAPELCNDIKAGPIGGLINNEDPLHHASSCGASRTASTSERTALLALSRLPSSSQPAARVWPPPPRRRAMAQASTPLAVRTLIR